MLRCELERHKMARLDEVQLVDAKIMERYDLQKMILACPSAFFQELGERNLVVIGSEVRPSELVGDSVDVLALDSEEGDIVVVELKRGKDKYQLLQAIHYAAMLAEWGRDEIIQQYAKFKGYDQVNLEEAEEELRELEVDLGTLNKGQRCILLAEDYEPDVLMTANWLYEQFRVPIRCFRLRAVRDQVSADGERTCYLDVERIVPPLALEEYFGGRTRRPAPPGKQSQAEDESRQTCRAFWSDLKDALVAAGHKWAENRTPSGDHWFSFSTGRSAVNVVASFARHARLRAELSMCRDDPAINKELFDELRKREQDIVGKVQGTLSWERMDDYKWSRLAIYRECDREKLRTDPGYRKECIAWLVQGLAQLREVATEYLI